MNELQNEIYEAGNDGDLSLLHCKTLTGLVFEETSDFIAGEAVEHSKMNKIATLLTCLENELNGMEAIHDRMWKAARRATHPKEAA